MRLTNLTVSVDSRKTEVVITDDSSTVGERVTHSLVSEQRLNFPYPFSDLYFSNWTAVL